MDFKTLVRLGIFLAVLGYVFNGDDTKPDNKPEPAPVVEPYTGSLVSLHSSSRQMDETDRKNMSEGFAAGADMLDADKKGLVKRTDIAQTYLLGLLEFNYNGIAKPSTKYPGVASEVEKVFTDTLGEDIAPMNASDRSKLSSALREMAKAIR